MDNVGIIITVIGIIIALVVMITQFIAKKHDLTVKGVEIFGIEFGVKKKKVDKIQILSVPLAACKGNILTPYLKVMVLDNEGNAIKKKRVQLEFYNDWGLISVNSILGDLVKYSNKLGCVKFDNICLKETGRIHIYIKTDEEEQYIDSVDIFPPGLEVDYWNEIVGTEQYGEKFERLMTFIQKQI